MARGLPDCISVAPAEYLVTGIPMSVKSKAKHVLVEMRNHIPFTALGAVLGLVFMWVFRFWTVAGGRQLFTVFHPAHVLLSAVVTASLFKLHRQASSFAVVLIVGYLASVGLATLSDCVIPYVGEQLLGLDIPTHQEVYSAHSDNVAQHAGNNRAHSRYGAIHLGFIEEWYLVNPAAILGISIAFLLPRTKLPHAGHIFVSTWASLSHILMNMSRPFSLAVAAGVLGILFLAVWLPCCFSDIVFPLLFVEPNGRAVPLPVHK
jgi:hypothetical protein